MITSTLALTFAIACNFGLLNDADPAGAAPGADTPDADTPGDDPGDALCPEDTAVFEEHVWAPVLGQQCALCHQAGEMAGGTAMVLDPDDMLASLRAASAVADRLLSKPTGLDEDGHGGGALVLEDSEEYEALAFWVDWTLGVCEVPEDEVCDDALSARRLWRLSHAEYDRAVSDLLGQAVALGAAFAADEAVDGFANDADALRVSSLLADQYRAAAESLGEAADLDALLPCDPADIGQAACAAIFAEDLGLRAFRRPLTAEELDRYTGLWDAVAVEDGFDAGARWVITALLQSPYFLYRSELGARDSDGRFALSDWEIAAELSFLIWGTGPDSDLLAAAEDGALHTGAQIQAQAERLLADPRALETAADFVEDWLLLDRLSTVSREGLSDELRASMRAATRALVADVAAEGTLADLMTARQAWVDESLAAHYGLDDTGWVLRDDGTYGGLLAEASVLTTYAHHDTSSPVHRGVVVRERLLCDPLPPPPEDQDVSAPEVDPDLTTRERFAEHSENPQCAACHDRIDPIGFGFEHFDALGLWRERDGGHPVDASGDVDGATFYGVAELSELLLSDARFRACFVETWRRRGTGAESCADDPGEVGLLEPLAALTRLASFTHREGGPGEGDTPADGPRLDLDDLPEDDGDYGDGGLSWSIAETDRWGSGYCAEGVVSNDGVETVTWSFQTAIEGEISSIWSAEAHDVGDEVLFSGPEWAPTLGPGEVAIFGFCAAL